MSKATSFRAKLEALCKECDVQLCVSSYDSLQVWDLNEGEPVLYTSLEDHTEETLNSNEGCWKEVPHE